MNKMGKRILVIALAVILLAAVAVLANVSPMLLMKPTETGKVLDTGIYAVKNNRNSLFLIESNDGYIVIDAGSDAAAAEDSLKQIPIDPLNVKYVLLTHSDYDHVASLKLFSNAQIYMNIDEMQMIDGSTHRNAFGSNSLPEGIDLDKLVLLEDGQKLMLGEKTVECIQMPGHTPGSMAYLLDGQYLFTGDAFKVSNNIMNIHPYTMDKETSKESMRRLDSIRSGSQLILTAHYGYHKADELKLK